MNDTCPSCSSGHVLFTVSESATTTEKLHYSDDKQLHRHPLWLRPRQAVLIKSDAKNNRDYNNLLFQSLRLYFFPILIITVSVSSILIITAFYFFVVVADSATVKRTCPVYDVKHIYFYSQFVFFFVLYYLLKINFKFIKPESRKFKIGKYEKYFLKKFGRHKQLYLNNCSMYCRILKLLILTIHILKDMFLVCNRNEVI